VMASVGMSTAPTIALTDTRMVYGWRRSVPTRAMILNG
jgi:hypothetical protein